MKDGAVVKAVLNVGEKIRCGQRSLFFIKGNNDIALSGFQQNLSHGVS